MKNANKKIYVAFMVICLIFLVILARSFQLQVLEHKELSDKAMALSKLDIDIEPIRGDILDSQGNVLATSAKYYDFWVTKTDVNYENMDEIDRAEFEEDLVFLSANLNVPVEDLRKRIFTGNESNLLAKDVSKEVADRIIESKPGWLAIASRYKRVYPYQSLGCHLIGVTNEEGVGLSGLELSFNDQLSGTRGKYVIDTDLRGNALALSDTKRYPSSDGKILQTTLDINIQQYSDYWSQVCLEETEAERVVMIVMETKTGAIKALSAPPFFDLNAPYELPGIDKLSGEAYVDYLYKTWGNPAVEALFEPGSVGKLLTVSAGLEEGAITMNTQFYCDGVYEFPVEGEDISIECWVYPNSHGQQDTANALLNSCNPAFVQMGQMIGGDRLYHYLEAFGLERRTRVAIGNEAFPLLPKPQNIVEEATMTYGYSYAVTPLQMLSALNGVVNHGDLMQTTIFEKIIEPDGETLEENPPQKLRSVISPMTSELVRDMMALIVNVDDQKRYDTKGIPMGGKTGTTNLMIDGIYSEDFGKRLTYYLTAPIQDPRYSIYLHVDQPKKKMTSTDNANYVISLMQDILRYVGYGVGDVQEDQIVEVPNLIGHSPDSALSYLKDMGLGAIYKNYDSLDEEALVLEQFPRAGEQVLRGANVIVNFGADMSGLHTNPPKKGLYETYVPQGTLLPEQEEYWEEEWEESDESDESDESEGGE
ncbi:MAG: PASTA domain-containing protein [Tissierellia bacterium]|nr:PASTA domain-containing protein [Tissierellia bacterium]